MEEECILIKTILGGFYILWILFTAVYNTATSSLGIKSTIYV